MASLLPLLYDLFPIIMPSEVRISHDKDLLPVAERAEAPPYHQTSHDDAQGHLGQQDDQEEPREPIRLLDREENSAVPPNPPTVYRRDAMVGATDKMCATG